MIEDKSAVFLHAAAFEPAISNVAMIAPLSSYHSLLMNEYYDPRFIQEAVPYSHTAYDLPDLASSLAPRKLLIINPVDRAGNTMDVSEAEDNLYIFIISSFTTKRYTT